MRKKREKRNGFQSVEEQFERICFMYFCMTKSTKSHLRGSLLEISLSFPTLPKREQYIPSRANISSEPSDYRQRQECRFQCTGCLLDFALCHADTARGMPFPLSAHRLHARPPLPLYAGVEPAHTRICSVLSCDMFARVVSIKPWRKTDLSFLLYSFAILACHAILPATQSRMRKEFKRGMPSSFCPFRTFRTSEKYMVLFCYFSDRRKVPFTYCYLSDRRKVR